MAERRPDDMTTFTVTHSEAHTILTLRLLIARAASTDSLAWWEDDSLTPHAAYLLQRLFPVAPEQAARSLALVAATVRHQAVCSAGGRGLHLYHLDADGREELAVRSLSLADVTLSHEPLTTIGLLREHLAALVGAPMPYTIVRETDAHALQVEIPPPAPGVSLLTHRARTLAWAYLEGSPKEPVFPFILEQLT